MTVDDPVERVAVDAAVRRAWEIRTERERDLAELVGAYVARSVARLFR